MTQISRLSSRRRGGSFFTMVIFIMMLISTSLMYYFFQRSRSLEREVASIRSGEPQGGNTSNGFFGMMPWSKAAPPADDTAITPGAASPRPATPPVQSSESQLAGAPAEGVVLSSAADPRPAATSAALNLEPDTLQPEETADAPSSENPEEDLTVKASEGMSSDQASAAEDEQPEASAEATTPVPDEGQSLYNLQSAPVRVRAPKRQ